MTDRIPSFFPMCIYTVCPFPHSNLMAAVSLLPPPPDLDHVTSVAQWLELLELSHLEGKFSDYSLERLSGFWEVELAAVSV